MKSIGLAIIISALTAVGAALDLSAAHTARSAPTASAHNAEVAPALTAAIANKAVQVNLDGEDDDDEGDGELVRTFLVTPRQASAANSKATELQYD